MRFDRHEIQSSHLISQLIDCVDKANCLLIIDLTDNINFSSQPEIHGVYRYLSQSGLPNNLIIMAALVNNRVYQNYSLNFTLVKNLPIELLKQDLLFGTAPQEYLFQIDGRAIAPALIGNY